VKSLAAPRSCLALLVLAFGALLHAQTATQTAPQKITVHFDPARTEIHWTLGATLHSVHGAFKLKGGLISFVPETGEAEGEILVDLSTGESGNEGRDSHMQKDVLESARYPQAIFHPTKVTGAIKAGAAQDVTVEGTFTIHGADHPLQMKANVRINGQDATATLHFTVPYVAWGMKDPSSFALRVEKKVDVEVVSTGTLEGLR
jgi:polyisoprenoid-binding protein YceI